MSIIFCNTVRCADATSTAATVVGRDLTRDQVIVQLLQARGVVTIVSDRLDEQSARLIGHQTRTSGVERDRIDRAGRVCRFCANGDAELLEPFLARFFSDGDGISLL
eukprot:1174011-Pleurochrysis_carterae.AAC.1